jgi:hypothetical protein
MGRRGKNFSFMYVYPLPPTIYQNCHPNLVFCIPNFGGFTFNNISFHATFICIHIEQAQGLAAPFFESSLFTSHELVMFT